jgi:RNA polymerase primary sigma factor
MDKLLHKTSSLDSILNMTSLNYVYNFMNNSEEAEPIENVHNYNVQKKLNDILLTLSEREKKIIQLRYGLIGNAPLTLKETGQIMGITRERVRQIQLRATHKLKNNSNFNALKASL